MDEKQHIAILRFAKHIKECNICNIGEIVEEGPLQAYSSEYCGEGFILKVMIDR